MEKYCTIARVPFLFTQQTRALCTLRCTYVRYIDSDKPLLYPRRLDESEKFFIPAKVFQLDDVIKKFFFTTQFTFLIKEWNVTEIKMQKCSTLNNVDVLLNQTQLVDRFPIADIGTNGQ